MKYTSRQDLADALKSLTHRQISKAWHPLEGADSKGFYVFWALSSRTTGLDGEEIDFTNTPEPEVDFDLLDEVLSELAPNISVLAYKRLLSHTVRGEAHHMDDPYTSMQVATKHLSFEHVLDALCRYHNISLPPEAKKERPLAPPKPWKY